MIQDSLNQPLIDNISKMFVKTVSDAGTNVAPHVRVDRIIITHSHIRLQPNECDKFCLA